jgi:cytoskeletal protein CcmA (bactofilin family)
MVEADVEANSAVVAGKVVGNLNARESVELQANSDVEGDIRTKSLVVEQGAVFCGGCHMKNGKSAAKFLAPEEDKQLKIDEEAKETEQAKK